MYVVVNIQQTIWDLAIKYYASVSGVKQLIEDNPGVVNFNDTIAAGTLILITQFEAPSNAAIAQNDTAFGRYYITAKMNQSLWDLAIKHYGASAGVKQLILDNPSVDFSIDIPTGTKFLISSEPIAAKMVDYLTSNGIEPSTAIKHITNWILAYGSWDDLGIWIDNSFWTD